MEIITSVTESDYNAIRNEKLRERLTSLRAHYECNFNGGQIPISDFVKNPYPNLVRLRAKDMQRMLTYVNHHGVLEIQMLEDIQRRRRIPALNIPNGLAFSAIALITADKFSNNEVSKAEISGPWPDFPWLEVLTKTQEELGNHPLASLIRAPGTITQLAETGRSTRSATSVKEVRIGAAKYLPIFDKKALETLEQVELISLIARIGCLPPGQVEGVSSSKHGAVECVLQAALSVYWASKCELEKFDNSDSCPVNLFRGSLILCRDYLVHYSQSSNPNLKEITNLRLLFEHVEKAVLKTPEKYGKAPTSVR